MPDSSLLITDTNIWIDLHHGGILSEVFQLPFELIVPDLAISELLEPDSSYLQKLGLRFVGLQPEHVLELIQLRRRHTHLSVIDLAAYLLAKHLDIPLLSGDRRLTMLATTDGIRVHGVLWLLDEMVRLNVILPGKACLALEAMLSTGARLPAEECQYRRKAWGG